MVECSHLAISVLLSDEQVASVEPQKWTCEGVFYYTLISSKRPELAQR